MRIALFVLLATRLSIIDGNCDCDELDKELESERKSDAEDHACRSCKVPDISHIACPAIGYQCDDSWGISTNKLSADDDCICLKARCAGLARLAVDGIIVDNMRCNASKWMVHGAVAKSVVCARGCDVGVCKTSNYRASPDFTNLKVAPAQGNNKCARGYCDAGFKLAALHADGGLKKLLDPVAEVICSGDGKWSYGEGEGDKAQYVMCIPSGASLCRSCAENLIEKTVVGNGAKPMDEDVIDKDAGTCARRAFTCRGPNSNIEVNHRSGVVLDGEDGEVDGTTTMVLSCNPAGTGWIFRGDIVTQVECAAGNIPGSCKKCAPELISITVAGAGAKPMDGDDKDDTGSCTTRMFTCLGMNSNIEVNNHAGVASDADDGVVDGKATFTVTCNSAGTAWMSGIFPITQVECAIANPVTPRCRTCAKNLITITTSGAGAKPMNDDHIFDSDPPSCAMRTFTCIGYNSNIEMNIDEGVVSDASDGKEDGTASALLTCNADGTGWTYKGEIVTEAECSIADVVVVTPQCRSCTKSLITITTSGVGAQAMDSDYIFNTDPASCATRRFTCVGKESSIEVNRRSGVVSDKDDDVVDGTTTMVLSCNPAGTGWTHRGEIVDQVECSTAEVETPECNTCASELISITTSGAGAKSMDSDVIVRTTDTCASRTLSCLGENSNIEINRGEATIPDSVDGEVDNTARLGVTCNADGSAWMSSGRRITHVECAASTADPLTKCKSCPAGLIVVTNAQDMDRDEAVTTGPCAVRTFTCKSRGNSAVIEINGGDGGTVGPADATEVVMSVTCNAAGTAWEYEKVPVTRVECSKSQ